MGGHKKLKMAHLKSMMEDLGFKEVKTYIQSGNVVFSSDKNTGLSEIISKEIENRFGWKVPVLVKKAADISEILNNCPFEESKKIDAYFMLLAEPPKKEFVQEANKISVPNEEFIITSHCVYIYYATGAGNAKLSNNFFEKKLKASATTRNYRTLAKLVELAQ